MQFGLSISGMAVAPMPDDGGMSHRLADIISWVRHARDMGFDYISTGQHYVSHPYQNLHPIPLLARLAAESGSMRLHTTILFPLQHPVELAEQMATLDIITGGKLTIGVGIGYREEEYAAFGVDSKQRVSRMSECLDILIKLWTQPFVTYNGRHFQMDGVGLSIRPLQKPHPPMWVAASSNSAVERAARLGLPWHMNPHAAYETLSKQVQLYRKAAHEAGQPTDTALPINRELYCANTTQQALEEAAPYLDSKYKEYGRWGQDKVLPGSENFQIDFSQLLQDRFIIGSPEHCINEIGRLKQLGVGIATFRMSWAGMPVELSLKSMKLLAEQVIPKFR